jgi:hypothetical protein
MIIEEVYGLKNSYFHQNLCFKAQLFLHFKEEQLQFIGINPKAIIGTWYYFQEFKVQLFETFQFAILPKQDWPVLPQNADWVTWNSFEDCISNITSSMQEKRSVKLWIKTPEKIHQVFVVWEDDDM